MGRKLFALGLVLSGCAQPGAVPESLDGFSPFRGDGGASDFATPGQHACPPGFGDCDGNPANGCETSLSSADNCGACGNRCQMVGGSNACVLVGASYGCKPTCDGFHADCNGNPNDGCETDISTVNACGGCSSTCVNPHGVASCKPTGSSYACQPGCASGWSACGAPSAGCATQTDSDPDHCGGCSRACSSTNVSARSCSGGVCKPTCAAPWSDCSDPIAPAADDGCETNGTADPGENDNSCPGRATPDVGEGSSNTITGNRILPSGDTDTYTVWLREGSHLCFPGTGQSYNAKISFTGPPEGTPLQVSAQLGSCNNTWQSLTTGWICVNWSGTCSATDDLQVWFQMSGVGGAASCNDYAVTVQYCTEGNKCPGC